MSASEGRGTTEKLRRYLIVGAILLSGMALKGALLSTRAVSFDSDEAVMALMARHILEGEHPVFFYGQTYMGSLDAYLISIAFRLFGTNVTAVRLVQMALFAGLILATYHLARRLYRDQARRGESIAQISALLTALPPALVSLYTTITLGGYGEMLLFGTVLLILGHQVTHESADSWWRWGLMGCIAGLAFWTLPLSVVYMVPVGLAILLKWRWRHAGQYGLALAAFALGSSPWWGYCLGHGDACLQPLLDSPAELVVSGGWLQTLWHRVFSLLLLGIPSLWGLRYPWTAELIVSPLVVPVLALYLGSIVYALRAKNRHRFLPLAMGATFLVVFLGTPFGNDATGRYLLPLYLLVALLAAEMLSALRARSRWLAAAGLACLVAFNTGGTLWAALTEPAGLTAQLDARLQFGNEHDAELIAFLQESGEQYGYGNYWLAFKINFLSGEEIVVAPRLPYKANLTYNPADDRYPAYSRLVDGAPGPPFYLTCNQPELDTRLRQALDAGEIDYQEQVIGAYHVFYSLSVAASPEELGIHGEQ